MKPYRLETTCVLCGDGDAINEMVGSSQPITRRTFLRYVSIEHLRGLERSLGYETHPARGLTMAADFHVSYAKGTWKGRPCVFFTWSRIEHIFTQEGGA